MSEHSPEPWEVFDGAHDRVGIMVATKRAHAPNLVKVVVRSGAVTRANAQRICACVNTSRGIPTKET